MKTKKLVSFLLVLTMLSVFMLSGCGITGPAGSGGSDVTPDTSVDGQQPSDTKKDDSWTLLEPLKKKLVS